MAASNTANSNSLDITETVQETLNSYQRMFGNKNIDFNADSSAFTNIRSLVADLPSKLITSDYRLVLFYESGSERSQFEVKYGSDGLIQKD